MVSRVLKADPGFVLWRSVSQEPDPFPLSLREWSNIAGFLSAAVFNGLHAACLLLA
jgi:hypothetical protein